MWSETERVMLGIIMDLCEMCRRLLIIIKNQQIELEKLNVNKQMLDQWRRETDAIERKYNQIEK